MMMITSQSPCRPIVFILFFLLAAAAFAQQTSPPPAEPPIYHLYFNLRTETFTDLLIQLRMLLISYSSKVPYNPTHVRRRFVLGPRRENFHDAPPAWIHIHVVTGDGDGPEEQVTLAIAIDDLYLIGFRNGAGQWYQFSGGKINKFKGLPGAIVLPIQQNYGDLVGGHKNLNLVPLGRESAIYATKQLATYVLGISPKSQLKDGLARFVVMMCEGMRFVEIAEAFSSGKNWEKETFISQTQAKYVVHWGDLSKLVIRWELTKSERWGPQWGASTGYINDAAAAVSEYIGVNGLDDAVKILDFLIRPKGKVPTYY